MPDKTDKITDVKPSIEFLIEQLDFFDVKEGIYKQAIVNTVQAIRKADRESLIEKIKTFKCSVPLNIRTGHPLSEENVENAIIYAGRYNYNKALSDIFDYLKSL
jgi:hypothetical protein